MRHRLCGAQSIRIAAPILDKRRGRQEDCHAAHCRIGLDAGCSPLVAAVAAVPQARADDFPSRPLRLIIGFPPGSAADITARLVGDAMSQTLGQQVVVESPPRRRQQPCRGVRRARPGGRLHVVSSARCRTSPMRPFSSNLRFDFAKDFAPVTPLTGLPLILAVHPSLGVSSFKEFIALAKSKPGELTYASVGLGDGAASRHRAVQRAHEHQARSRALPGQPAGGHRSACRPPGDACWGWPRRSCRTSKPAGSRRSPRARPSVRTSRRTCRPSPRPCCPDFESSVWFGLVAPAGTPRAVIEKLAAAANAALKSDDVVSRLKAAGFEPLGGSPDEFARIHCARDSSSGAPPPRPPA